MNRHRLQLPSRRRLLGVTALALLLAGLSGSTTAPAAPSPGSPRSTVPVATERLGGQSAREIQRQAEQRALRRQRRRIRRDGDGATRVRGASAARTLRVPIVLALCALLALPAIASRLSSRRT